MGGDEEVIYWSELEFQGSRQFSSYIMRNESTIILFSIAFLTATLKMFVVSFHPFQLNKDQFCTNTESRGRRKTMETNSNHPADPCAAIWLSGGGKTYHFSTQLDIFRGGGHPLHHLKGSVEVAWCPNQRHAVVDSPQPTLQFHLPCGQRATKIPQPCPHCVCSLDNDPHHTPFKWKLCELVLCVSSGWRLTRAHESLGWGIWESDRAVPTEGRP